MSGRPSLTVCTIEKSCRNNRSEVTAVIVLQINLLTGIKVTCIIHKEFQTVAVSRICSSMNWCPAILLKHKALNISHRTTSNQQTLIAAMRNWYYLVVRIKLNLYFIKQTFTCNLNVFQFSQSEYYWFTHYRTKGMTSCANQSSSICKLYVYPTSYCMSYSQHTHIHPFSSKYL